MMQTENIPILGWRIYYADGSIVSSQEQSWEESPADGVEVVVVFYEKTYPIHRDGEWLRENYVCRLHGGDYYWRTEGVGFACGTAGECSGQGVKTGQYLPDDAFLALYNQALRDSVY